MGYNYVDSQNPVLASRLHMAKRDSRFKNRIYVAEMLNCSPDSLSDYERGKTRVPEDVLLRMSQIFQDPLLPWNYWAINSLIAKHYGIKAISETDSSKASLRIIYGVNQIAKKTDGCIRILGDAKIDSDETQEFMEIANIVGEVSREMTFLKLVSGTKEKTVLAETA